MRTVEECVQLLSDRKRRNWNRLTQDERVNAMRHAVETHFPDAQEVGISALRWEAQKPKWAPGVTAIRAKFKTWNRFIEEMGLPSARDQYNPQCFMYEASQRRTSLCDCKQPSTHWPIVQILGAGGGHVLIQLALCDRCYAIHLENEKELIKNGIRAHHGDCGNGQPLRAGVESGPRDHRLR